MSCTSVVANLHVLITDQETQTTKNVIYPEVLQDINGIGFSIYGQDLAFTDKI
jgi:hypothetical protein